MSKRPGQSTGGRPGSSSGYGRPKSTTGGERPGSKAGAGGGAQGNKTGAKQAAAAPEPPRRQRTFMEGTKEFELPAISILLQKKPDKGAEWQEKRKKKMVRRNVPPTEDTNKLQDILKSLKDQEINVHEFVGLIAPSTGDQALGMRNILAEEMTTFRKMCRRVYDTMTQDVSDVLANEQVQLTDNSNDRIAVYTDKMMRSIDEIFAYIPDFDFEKYYQDDDYLKNKFPLCVAEAVSADDEEILLRQEAFHRYQWLRSEGDRLGAENTRLQERLNYLKKQQKDEMGRAQDIQVQNEERRGQLEATEEALQEKVEELNKSIDQSMVENEVSAMKSFRKGPPKQKGELKMTRRKLEVKPDWNVGAAQDVEELAAEAATQGQISQVSMAGQTALTPSTGAVRKQLRKPKAGKKRQRFQPQEAPPQDASPFHYSPPKSPPGYEMPGRSTSPFHYSPDRGSPQGASGVGRSQGQRSPPERTVRMETSTTVTEPTRIQKGPQYSHHRSENLW